MNELESLLYEHLEFLYGAERALPLSRRLAEKLRKFRQTRAGISASSLGTRFSERDVILITYGDMVQKDGQSHLRTLNDTLRKYISGLINTVHLLPFYTYSSDDGYAVIDYRSVNPDLGTWEDIGRLKDRFSLMFDGVFNHISASSAWFQGFLREEQPYRDYFITVEPDTDLSHVFRPRATPPYTEVLTSSGRELVWTTYSADQIDLNYKNPEVLFEVIGTILYYVSRGMDIIRMDGAAYLWKEAGTSCINLPQTHTIIRLIRTVLDNVAPHVTIFTQTNVPHDENVRYFGDGENEAQLIYNFALPFMTLHAFHKGNAEALSQWAESLDWSASGQGSYFNFLVGHDGIGMLPVYDLLPKEEITAVVERIRALGGNVSDKVNEDGTLTPYELNINYLDALDDPKNPIRDATLISKRFLASQAIMLSLPGVPGIYFHSLFGSRGWCEGVMITGQPRTINRQKLEADDLERELEDTESLRNSIYQGYARLLTSRVASPAFHPAGPGQILFLDPKIFTILRISPDRGVHVICLHNVSDRTLNININLRSLPIKPTDRYIDMSSGSQYFPTDFSLDVAIGPYEVVWLRGSEN